MFTFCASTNAGNDGSPKMWKICPKRSYMSLSSISGGLLGDVNQLIVILEERVAGVEPLGQRRGHDAQRQSGRERDQNLEAP